MKGWVRLYRCTMDKAIWKNHNLYRVFSWCIMKASYSEHETIVGMTKVILQPGQFIFGRSKAAEELGMKASTVVDCMKWLKGNNTIDIKSDNKKSVITVVNWAMYQSDEDESDSKSNSKSDNSPTTARQQPDTNKNTKKIKEEKENMLTAFEEFWKLYPKKTAKQDCVKLWGKIKAEEHQSILDGLKSYLQSKAVVTGYAMGPDKWLRGRRWEDNMDDVSSVPGKTMTKAQADAMDKYEYIKLMQAGWRVIT